MNHDENDAIPVVLTEGKFKGVVFTIDDIVVDDSSDGTNLQISYSIHSKPEGLEFTTEEFEEGVNHFVLQSIQNMIDHEKGAVTDASNRNDNSL